MPVGIDCILDAYSDRRRTNWNTQANSSWLLYFRFNSVGQFDIKLAKSNRFYLWKQNPKLILLCLFSLLIDIRFLLNECLFYAFLGSVKQAKQFNEMGSFGYRSCLPDYRGVLPAGRPRICTTATTLRCWWWTRRTGCDGCRSACTSNSACDRRMLATR